MGLGRFVRSRTAGLLAVVVGIPAVQAQTAPERGDPAPDIQEVVVTGSQIANSQVTTALPVTVVSAEQIAAVGATSGDDLLRSIPQMGDVTFNPSNNPQTSNAARGDVNSINLRNLGVGNTLVLLNGRRLVSHPTSQAGEGNVPVLGYNSNAIPVAGVERLEILRDGAAAIYGSDAVAGVVNTVTKTDLNGGSFDFRYGGPEGTSRRVRAEFPLILTDWAVTPPEYLGVGVGSRLLVKVTLMASPVKLPAR